MTKSIILRSVVESDSKLLFEWINNKELVVFNAPFRPISLTEHEAWFSNIPGRPNLAFFMIEDIESKSTIGSCQLLNINSVHSSADLQIRIGRISSQNSGAGSEAVRQLADHGFSVLKLHRIALQVFASNARAIRVYEKNGFVHEGLLRQAVNIDGHWQDVVVMARLSESSMHG